MGGDHAPDEIVQGAAEASIALTSAEIILLKMLEGVSETVVRLARYAHKERLAEHLGLTSDLVPIAPARAPPDDPVSELEFGA